jgi:hypothetical protein
MSDFSPLTPNRWTLMKIHFDTSTPSGVYEMWIRTVNGPWVKVVEWIDCVTPGFTWHIQPAHIGGHRGFAMPTTMGADDPASPRWGSWVYLDDFAMARSEAGCLATKILDGDTPEAELLHEGLSRDARISDSVIWKDNAMNVPALS